MKVRKKRYDLAFLSLLFTKSLTSLKKVKTKTTTTTKKTQKDKWNQNNKIPWVQNYKSATESTMSPRKYHKDLIEF